MTDTTNTNLAARLQMHADVATQNPVKSHFEKLVAVRRTILDLCSNGHTARQITEWLAAEKIHIAGGTVRNYIARIRTAEQYARDRGIQNADDAEILCICYEIEREKSTRLSVKKTAKSGAPAAKQYVQQNKTMPVHGIRQSPPMAMSPRSDNAL